MTDKWGMKSPTETSTSYFLFCPYFVSNLNFEIGKSRKTAVTLPISMNFEIKNHTMCMCTDFKFKNCT